MHLKSEYYFQSYEATLKQTDRYNKAVIPVLRDVIPFLVRV